jgi:hypothetical protein
MNNIKLSLANLTKSIDAIALPAKRLSAAKSFTPLNEHISQIMSFNFIDNDYENKDIIFNKIAYTSLAQYTLENTNLIEDEAPLVDNLNWDLFDEVRAVFKNEVKKRWQKFIDTEIGQEAFVFVVDCFENWLVYKQLHPNSTKNPWIKTNEILQENGFMYFLSDNLSDIEKYNSQIPKHERIEDMLTPYSSKLMMIASNSKKNEIKPLNNIEKMQAIVLQYLKSQHTKNKKYVTSKTLSKVLLAEMYQSFEKDWNQKFNPQRKFTHLSDVKIKNIVLLPLKRLGLIGTSNSGLFYIDNLDDIEEAKHFLTESQKRIQKTLSAYEHKARLMGY